jgi:hypothetical protein
VSNQIGRTVVERNFAVHGNPAHSRALRLNVSDVSVELFVVNRVDDVVRENITGEAGRPNRPITRAR